MNGGQVHSHTQEEKYRRLTLDTVQQGTRSSAPASVSNYLSAGPDAGLMRKLEANPQSLPPNQVLQLQRLVGNHMVQRLLASSPPITPTVIPAVTPAVPQVQMLRVDAADTRYEEEADDIAQAVVQGKRPAVQRNATGDIGPEGGDVDEGLERQIKGATGGGSLPGSVRKTLEPKLGVDLKGVKVHTGAKSADLNRQLNAKAFTYKNNIFYGGGQSPSDLSLTTHEVVHTMHQGAVHKKATAPEEEV